MTADKKSITFKLDDSLYIALKALAEKENRTISNMLQLLVSGAVAKKEGITDK